MVPQFVPMFADMNVEMPLITKIVLAVGDSSLLVAGGVRGAHRGVWFRRSACAIRRRAGIRWRCWTARVGDVTRKIETARLARTLGTLLKNGVPLLTGLSVARNVMNNTVLGQAVGRRPKK